MMSDATPAREDPTSGDHVVRAITDDDNFRVITANTTETVQDAIDAQDATGRTAQHFADLITGTVLIRETMSPVHRVQGLLKGRGGRGSLVADTHPDGLTRGLVQLADGQPEFELGEGSALQMMRSMARGVHRSVVQPPVDGRVAEALMTYMQESEQIVAMIAAGSRWRDDRIEHAGGFVVQLLPGTSRGPLMVMTERLEDMPPIGELLGQLEGSAHRMVEELLYGMPFAQLEVRSVAFGCKCSLEAVVSSLATIDREEIAEMFREQEVLEISCDYCNAEYKLGRSHLRGLLQSS